MPRAGSGRAGSAAECWWRNEFANAIPIGAIVDRMDELARLRAEVAWQAMLRKAMGARNMSLPSLSQSIRFAPGERPERPEPKRSVDPGQLVQAAAAFVAAWHKAQGLDPPEPVAVDPVVSARADAAFILAAAQKARICGTPEPIEPAEAGSAKADAAAILKLYNEHREANRRC